MLNIENLVGNTISVDNKEMTILRVTEENGKYIFELKEKSPGENKTVTETMPKEKHKYAFSEASLNYFKNVHPYLVKVMKAAITESPYDFRITAGARTAKEQNALYQIGRTRAGNKVTNCDGYKSKSNHQIKADGYGYAVDIFCCGKYDENGNYIKYNTQEGYDSNKLKDIADHIKTVSKSKGYEIEWGGDWKGGWDSPHFELKL